MKPSLIDISKINNKKILLFGAHSDDVEFLMGGTVLRLGDKKLNNHIIEVIATDGQMGTHDIDHDHQNLISDRQKEARRAAECFGAKKTIFWSYPDLDLQNRKKQLLKKVIKLLFKHKPDLVFSFDPWGRYDAYVHPDHRALAWAVTEGVMLATIPKWVKKNGLGNRYLSPKPQLWLYAPAEPNVVVDVSENWLQRLDLLKIFETQYDDDFKYEKVEKILSLVFGSIGNSVGVEHAEGFRILEYFGELDINK